MATTPMTAVAIGDRGKRHRFFDSEHPVADDLNYIGEKAQALVAQAVWHLLTDRDGVIDGLNVTFAGGVNEVTVASGSLIVQGNQAQHQTAVVAGPGTDAAYYLYGRPSWWDTESGDRNFVVGSQPVNYRGVSAAPGETPDGTKITFMLRHFHIMPETFEAYVDGDPATCTVTRGTGAGGYDEATFAVAPGAATTVTFNYSQEAGSYGAVQSVETQQQGIVEFSLVLAASPAPAGYVRIARVTRAGGVVTAVDNSYREHLYSFNANTGEVAPYYPRRLIDLLYDMEEGTTAIEAVAARYMGSLKPRIATAGLSMDFQFGGDNYRARVNAGAGAWGTVKAGMTILIPDAGPTYYSRRQVVSKEVSGADYLLVLDESFASAVTRTCVCYTTVGLPAVPCEDGFFNTLGAGLGGTLSATALRGYLYHPIMQDNVAPTGTPELYTNPSLNNVASVIERKQRRQFWFDTDTATWIDRPYDPITVKAREATVNLYSITNGKVYPIFATTAWDNPGTNRVVTNEYPITAVDQANGKFTVAGHHLAEFPNGSEFTVFGSTGNDDGYTVANCVETVPGVGPTVITVNAPVPLPDATVDGTLGYWRFYADRNMIVNVSAGVFVIQDDAIAAQDSIRVEARVFGTSTDTPTQLAEKSFDAVVAAPGPVNAWGINGSALVQLDAGDYLYLDVSIPATKVYIPTTGQGLNFISIHEV
ncbi:MAG: hypothetical protein WC551_10040 [Patescibacteria group bacterium]